MELLKIWEDWARKNGYTSLTQDGIIKTMVTEFCKHLESIPVEKRVSPTEPTCGNCKWLYHGIGRAVCSQPYNGSVNEIHNSKSFGCTYFEEH